MPSVRRRRAFTLVEMLVTVSLVAMVGGTVVAAVSGCLRVWERLRGAGQRDQWVQVAFEEMRTQLRSQRRFKPIVVEGAYDSVVFAGMVAADPPEGLGVEELGRIGYYFDVSRRILCRSAHPYRLIRQQRLRETCHPILTDVDRVRFAYFGADPESKTAGWSSSWSSQEPPLAVKVEVGYDERTTRRPVLQTLLVDVPLAPIR